MSDKRERNAEKSKQIILDAAEEQFALKGYYGARIDEIAEIAGLNKRMIYEYFINKEELYKTVLFTVYKRMEAAEQQLIEKAYAGVELIRQWIAMYFDFLHNNPGFVAILMWENLNKAQHLNEMPSENVERPTIRVLADEISRGKQSGIFRQSIDEKQVVISLITVCYANFSNSYTLSKLFHCDLNNLEMIETRKQHTIDIMLLGAGGKMGPTQAILARRAVEAAGLNKRIIAVSRFSDPDVLKLLKSNRVETIAADLADEEALAGLPDVPNIIFMAGKKFGTNGNESETWFMTGL